MVISKRLKKYPIHVRRMNRAESRLYLGLFRNFPLWDSSGLFCSSLLRTYWRYKINWVCFCCNL